MDAFSIFLIALALFAGMTGLMAAGHVMARRAVERDPHASPFALGPVEGAVFGLLGLLIAFTFSGAMSRFDTRRELIVAEAVALGSTWQMLDVAQGPARDDLRAGLRAYADARIALYREFWDASANERHRRDADRLQSEIWAKAIAANTAQGSDPSTTALLNALNETFDLATKRSATHEMHPPSIVFVMLIVMSLSCAFLAGQAMSGAPRCNWSAIIAFATLVALTVYVILDLEYPRRGLLRMDGFDRFLVEARAAMG